MNALPLNEDEWRVCTDPSPMLTVLSWVGMVGDRKLRLFAVAACRRVWFWLENKENDLILEEQEQFADGEWPQRVMRQDNWRSTGDWPGRELTVNTPGWSFALSVVQATKREVGEKEMAVQASLLRCIFGPLPFRSVGFNSCWLTPTVQAIADATYADKGFDRLPILADALEEAGCTDMDILNHLRQPDVHARGCWPLDLILGRE